jgi:hypothetical protein
MIVIVSATEASIVFAVVAATRASAIVFPALHCEFAAHRSTPVSQSNKQKRFK